MKESRSCTEDLSISCSRDENRDDSYLLQELHSSQRQVSALQKQVLDLKTALEEEADSNAALQLALQSSAHEQEFSRQSFETQTSELLDELEELSAFNDEISVELMQQIGHLQHAEQELEARTQMLRELQAKERFVERLERRVLQTKTLRADLIKFREDSQRLRLELRQAASERDQLQHEKQCLVNVIRHQQQNRLNDSIALALAARRTLLAELSRTRQIPDHSK
jgi:chromosome segregation ATPase